MSQPFVLPLSLLSGFRHLRSGHLDLVAMLPCDKVNAEAKVQRRCVIFSTDKFASCTEQGDIKRCVPYAHVEGLVLTTVILDPRARLDRPAIIVRIPAQYDLLLLPVAVTDVGRTDPRLFTLLLERCTACAVAEGRPLPTVERHSLYAAPPALSESLDAVMNLVRLRRPAACGPPFAMFETVLTPELVAPGVTMPPSVSVSGGGAKLRGPPRESRVETGSPGVVVNSDLITSPSAAEAEETTDAVQSERRQRAAALAASFWSENPESTAYELKRENDELRRRVTQLEAEVSYWRCKFLRSPPRQSSVARPSPSVEDEDGAHHHHHSSYTNTVDDGFTSPDRPNRPLYFPPPLSPASPSHRHFTAAATATHRNATSSPTRAVVLPELEPQRRGEFEAETFDAAADNDSDDVWVSEFVSV